MGCSPLPGRGLLASPLPCTKGAASSHNTVLLRAWGDFQDLHIQKPPHLVISQKREEGRRGEMGVPPLCPWKLQPENIDWAFSSFLRPSLIYRVYFSSRTIAALLTFALCQCLNSVLCKDKHLRAATSGSNRAVMKTPADLQTAQNKPCLSSRCPLL